MEKTAQKMSAVQALKNLRDDIKEMETHSVSGNLVLVPKADVLEIVQTWIEYALNPNEA